MEAIDRRTGKLFTNYGALNPRANTSRIYLPRKEGGRELISVADCVTIEQLSFNQYVQQSQEMLQKDTSPVLKPRAESDPLQYKQQRNDEKVEDWKGKTLHGQFLRQTEDVTSNLSWTLLKKGKFKKETEGLLIAAQD